MAASASPLRIGLIGLDHWYSAFSFAEAVAAHTDTNLVAVVDDDPARARELAARLGVERASSTRDDVLADDAIDVVASFVGSDQNPAVGAAAARAGKHVVSVKPVARTLAEATDLRSVVNQAGIVFLPSETRARLAPQHQQIMAWVREGGFGRIVSARSDLWGRLPERWPGDSDPGWWADPARVPGGGWIDHAIYGVDLLRWLLADEVALASGIAANLVYPDLPVEDFGAALLRFGGGAVANLEVTWSAPAGGGRHELGIVGTEGALAFDSLSGRLSLAGRLSASGRWEHRPPEAWDAEGIDHLVAAVRGEVAPIGTIDDAWRNLAACLAFYEAAAAGAAAAPAELPTGSDD